MAVVKKIKRISVVGIVVLALLASGLIATALFGQYWFYRTEKTAHASDMPNIEGLLDQYKPRDDSSVRGGKFFNPERLRTFRKAQRKKELIDAIRLRSESKENYDRWVRAHEGPLAAVPWLQEERLRFFRQAYKADWEAADRLYFRATHPEHPGEKEKYTDAAFVCVNEAKELAAENHDVSREQLAQAQAAVYQLNLDSPRAYEIAVGVLHQPEPKLDDVIGMAARNIAFRIAGQAASHMHHTDDCFAITQDWREYQKRTPPMLRDDPYSVLYLFGECYQQYGKPAQALAQFDEMANMPLGSQKLWARTSDMGIATNCWALARSAKGDEQKKLLDRAIDHFNRIVDSDNPDNQRFAAQALDSIAEYKRTNHLK